MVVYGVRAGKIRAVDGVSFTLDRGEVFGLAGESGSGKTTAALSIMRLIEPPGQIVGGSIRFDGQDVLAMTGEQLRKFRWKRVSMVMQGAMSSLDPLYRVGRQLTEAIRYHEKSTETEAWSRAKELLELVGIEESRAREYPHQFSGGMKQRAVIAMALSLNPDLVIADEPTTALDVMIQAQILDLLRDLQKKLRMSILLITHDVSLLAEFANRIGIMYAGRLMEVGPLGAVIGSPLHPYTRGLISSIPSLKHKKERLASIPGTAANLLNPPPGCRFNPRCSLATDLCMQTEPKLVEKRRDHFAACYNVS